MAMAMIGAMMMMMVIEIVKTVIKRCLAKTVDTRPNALLKHVHRVLDNRHVITDLQHAAATARVKAGTDVVNFSPFIMNPTQNGEKTKTEVGRARRPRRRSLVYG